MTAPSGETPGLAKSASVRFREAPHVASVRHFEGERLESVSTRVLATLLEFGVLAAHEVVTVLDRPTFHAVGDVPDEDAMAVWAIAREEHGLTCKLEVRVYHRLEDSALADEYLSRLGGRL